MNPTTLLSFGLPALIAWSLLDDFEKARVKRGLSPKVELDQPDAIEIVQDTTPAALPEAPKPKTFEERKTRLIEVLGEQPDQPNHLLAIEQFKADYLARGGNPDTWKREYQRFYDRLGEDDLKSVVTTTEPHTRNRKRAVTAINALSKFLGLGYDFGEYRGNYSPYRSFLR